MYIFFFYQLLLFYNMIIIILRYNPITNPDEIDKVNIYYINIFFLYTLYHIFYNKNIKLSHRKLFINFIFFFTFNYYY